MSGNASERRWPNAEEPTSSITRETTSRERHSNGPRRSEEPVPQTSSGSFKVDDYKVGARVDKSGCSHHWQGPPFSYYSIPDTRQELLCAHLISNVGKLNLCEHLDPVRKSRFFLDLDTKTVDGFNLKEFMKWLQPVLREALPEGVKIATSRAPMYKQELAQFFVNITHYEPYMCCAVAANKRETPTKRSFHLVWPFIYVTKRQRDLIGQAIKLACHKDHIQWEHFVDFPQTLRMIYCDRTEDVMGREMPANRPFLPHSIFFGDGKSMRPDPDQCPQYPFPYYDPTTTTIPPKEILIGFYALTSLRWPYWAAIASGTEQQQIDAEAQLIVAQNVTDAIPASIDNTSSASDWAKYMSQYDPVELENLFNADEEKSEESVNDIVVDYINKSVAYCHGSSPCVYFIKVKSGTGRFPIIKALKENDLKSLLAAPSLYYMNEVMNKDDEPTGKYKRKLTHPYKVWTSSARRREVSKVEFAPEKRSEHNVINLWRGWRWPVDECISNARYQHANGWSVIHIVDHILHVWCGGNANLCKYTLKYMASILQHPGKATDVVLILGGPEGCGKTLPLAAFGTIFGDSYMQTSNPDDVVGRFNGSMQDKLLVQIDEVDFLDGKQSASLRAAVTDTKKRVEFKGREIQYSEAPTNYVMTTNKPNQRFMQVGPQSRRFFMLSCNFTPKSMEPGYFHNMIDFLDLKGEMRGCKAFAGFLFSVVNMSNFNVRDIPTTQMLMEQKLTCMLPEHSFVLEALFRGCFTGTYLDHQNHVTEVSYLLSEDEPLDIVSDDIYKAYIHYCNTVKKIPENFIGFITQLTHLLVALGDYPSLTILNDRGQLMVRFPPKPYIRNRFRIMYKNLNMENGNIIGLSAESAAGSDMNLLLSSLRS